MADAIKVKKQKKVVKEKPIVTKESKNNLSMIIYGLDGKEEKTINLPKEIFGVKVNPSILAQYIRVYLINQRQGTASVKTRSEVTGSTRKIYRQKGTGKARHGDIKAPIFVGGGVVGGPKPKFYQKSINKKVKKIGLTMALSSKEGDKKIFGLSDKFNNIDGKTKTMINFFKEIKCFKEKILILLPRIQKNKLYLALRNIPEVEVTDILSVNPYQLLKARKVFLLEETLPVLLKRLEK